MSAPSLSCSYRQLPTLFFQPTQATPVPNPMVLLYNNELAAEIDFELTATEQQSLLSGNNIPETSLSQAYAGHQYGHFTLLGDGRAVLLGEHPTPTGQLVDIQLKGSGPTPFSRQGDGRAALGPMLREYIISEAMHHLGIPTTRSLAVVTTGAIIQREQALPGAILTRVAKSHIRIGTFQYAALHDDVATSQALLDYSLARHYPELLEQDNRAMALLEQISHDQADLICHWLRVGFVHGVMNTDNVAISGETLDYGPCAFLDAYHPMTTFSSIDATGRYAFGNQPKIAQWNLARLAESLMPLIHHNADESLAVAQDVITEFNTLFKHKWLTMMGNKLGIFNATTEDTALIHDLLAWMAKNQADYTQTFSDLSDTSVLTTAPLYQKPAFKSWSRIWQQRLEQQPQSIDQAKQLMAQTNPQIIPRNHQVAAALAAAEAGQIDSTQRLLAALKHPYLRQEQTEWLKQPPTPSEKITQTFCGT